VIFRFRSSSPFSNFASCIVQPFILSLIALSFHYYHLFNISREYIQQIDATMALEVRCMVKLEVYVFAAGDLFLSFIFPMLSCSYEIFLSLFFFCLTTDDFCLVTDDILTHLVSTTAYLLLLLLDLSRSSQGGRHTNRHEQGTGDGHVVANSLCRTVWPTSQLDIGGIALCGAR
jgi:hypothetical protein